MRNRFFLTRAGPGGQTSMRHPFCLTELADGVYKQKKVAGELHYLMGTGSCKTPSPPDQVEPEMLPNLILADVGAQNV